MFFLWLQYDGSECGFQLCCLKQVFRNKVLVSQDGIGQNNPLTSFWNVFIRTIVSTEQNTASEMISIHIRCIGATEKEVNILINLCTRNKTVRLTASHNLKKNRFFVWFWWSEPFKILEWMMSVKGPQSIATNICVFFLYFYTCSLTSLPQVCQKKNCNYKLWSIRVAIS